MGLVLVSTLALASVASAQDDPGWRVRVAPQLYLSNIDGINTASGFRFPVTDSVLEGGFALRADMQKGVWRFSLEYLRGSVQSTLAAGDPTAPVGSTDLSETTWEAYAARRIGPAASLGSLEILAGLRAVRHAQDLDFSSPEAIRETVSESWVGPFVGGSFLTEPGGPLWFSVLGNMGGFGLGANLAWVVEAQVGVVLHRTVDVTLRYRHFQTEYDNDGIDTDAYVWEDGQSQGWLIGLVVKP